MAYWGGSCYPGSREGWDSWGDPPRPLEPAEVGAGEVLREVLSCDKRVGPQGGVGPT